MWQELHSWAGRTLLQEPADLTAALRWLDKFSRRILCGKCRRHWYRLIDRNPITLDITFNLTRWTWIMHNHVNVRLGKPKCDWQTACTRWNWAEGRQPDPRASTFEGEGERDQEVALDRAEFAISKRKIARIDCVFAKPTARVTISRCDLALFGGSPHVAMCRHCDRRSSTKPSP